MKDIFHVPFNHFSSLVFQFSLGSSSIIKEPAIMLDLIKRFIIGKTRLNLPIRCYRTDSGDFSDLLIKDTENYSPSDFFDAYCAFEYLIQRSLKKEREFNAELELFEDNRKTLASLLDNKFFEEEKYRLNLHTSFDLCVFGSKLINFEFKNS